jgi:hypothetical protein
MRRALAFVLLALACSSEDAEPGETTLSRDELMDPETCKDCHADAYREWSGSMHAYAADDPVFLAMNRRGQEETAGELGDFCVQCHAPMAVREGATTDGLNLAEVPQKLKGVTCYFCHDAKEVTGTHNAPIALAGGTTMYGPFSNAVKNGVHRSSHSKLMDRRHAESAAFCGACHDIKTKSPPAPAEVHLERTFAEWQGTVFAKEPEAGGLRCGSCHMPSRDGVAADFSGVGLRRIHSHAMPGVDLALGPFPELDAQKALVEEALDQTLRYEVCVRQLPGAATLHVTLENISAGHNWPSGAAQDRRVWAEVAAFDGATLLYESGNVPPGQAATTFVDPDLWLIRDRALDENGAEAHMFWDIASIEANTIPGAVTFDPKHPDYLLTHVPHRYPIDGAQTIPGAPDRVTLKVWMEPIGLDVLDDLVASGHLQQVVRDAMPRHALLTNRGESDLALEWTPELAEDPQLGYVKQVEGVASQCVSSAPTVTR